jgi:hypothetical protein
MSALAIVFGLLTDRSAASVWPIAIDARLDLRDEPGKKSTNLILQILQPHNVQALAVRYP